MRLISLAAVTAFAMIASASALACQGGMGGGMGGMRGGQHGGMGMHAMMHGQGMDHGQMGQGCGQGGVCPMSGAAEQTSSDAPSAPASEHADHAPAVKK